MKFCFLLSFHFLLSKYLYGNKKNILKLVLKWPITPEFLVTIDFFNF